MLIDRARIKDKTEFVLNAMKLTSPMNTTTIEKAVNDIGGVILYKDMVQSGYVRKISNDKFEISCKKTDSKERQLFTIAHEIGHLYCHMNFGTEKWNNENEYNEYFRFGDSINESEANEFAGAFLMPENVFLKYLQDNCSDGNVNINDLAKYFSLSKDAVLTRGKILGYFK